MRATSILFACTLMGAAGVALAQPGEIVCAMESGAAAELCSDYCGAKACHRANDGDPETEPEASAADCERLRKRFRNATGRDTPCDEMVACPCADPARWAGEVRAGFTWYNFAVHAFNAVDTTCTDDSSQTKLEMKTPDADSANVSVDSALNECRVQEGPSKPQVTLRIGAKGAAACRRLLRRVGGDLCSSPG